MGGPDTKLSGLGLGINGLGRIGKLTLWSLLARRSFDRIVVNLGREVGRSFDDLAHYLARDSTYGQLHNFLHGCDSRPVIEEVDQEAKTLVANGVKVKFLTSHRNPAEIIWAREGVRLVVEATGRFLDPTEPADSPGGSCLGHLEAGAEKVILSAPFKIKDKRRSMPEAAVTTVMGINQTDYDPRKHDLVSQASCTTSCLAHMIKPLLDFFGPKRFLSASMATVHAATGSQAVLDRVPKAGAADLRKSRSMMDNIILTSTGAAKALSLVIPEMRQIGFIAESVRVPVATGSLIILVVNLHDQPGGDPIRREMINGVYRRAASVDKDGYLVFSEQQNVSSDIAGWPKAAAVIEGAETHTRTAEIRLPVAGVLTDKPEVLDQIKDQVLSIPVTQAVIYGWYDNEFGSYVNLLTDRTISVAQSL
jgi:glyceraldehyde 3-phosphate dehydrogenase